MYRFDKYEVVEYFIDRKVWISGVISGRVSDSPEVYNFRPFGEDTFITAAVDRLRIIPSTHGGFREGAGRKAKYPHEDTQRIEMTLPVTLVSKIDGRARFMNIDRQTLLTTIIINATRGDEL
jgi:hypothetical protein